MRVAIWIVFAVMAVVWSAGAWLLAAGVQWAGESLAAGGAVDLAASVSTWSLPSWLVVWLDLGWLQWVQLYLVEAIDSLREAWPDLGRAVVWLVPLIWGLWGIGLLTMLLLAGLGHWLAGRVARSRSTPLPA
jgi:hypothetical protein